MGGSESGREWEVEEEGSQGRREGGDKNISLCTHVWRMKAKCSDVVQLYRRGR